MLGRIIGASIVVAAMVLSVIFQTTSPSTAGPLGILIIFLFSYLLVLGVLTFLLFGLAQLRVRVFKFFNSKKPRQSLSLLKSYYFSSVLSLGPIILIGMQSVGEVSAYDVLLVFLFIGVACFYIAKRTL